MENPQDKKGHKTTCTSPETAEHIYTYIYITQHLTEFLFHGCKKNLAIGYCELKSAKYLTKWCTLTFYKVYYRFTVSSRIKELEKLGAGQSPM